MKTHFTPPRYNTVNQIFVGTFILFLISLQMGGTVFAQQTTEQRIDSLEKVIAKGNLSNEKLLQCYREIGSLYNYDPQKSLKYSMKGITLAEKTGNREIISDFYIASANAYYYLNKLDSSLLYCEKTIELYSTNGDIEQQTLGTALRIAGVIHTLQGNNDAALDYLYRSVEIAEKTNNKSLLSQVYSSIAYLYASVHNIKQAENYFIKMSNICIETGDSLNLTYSLYQLSNVYTDSFEHDKALQYAQEAYHIITSCHNADRPDYLIETVITLSDTWRYYDHTEVLKYAKEALSLTEKYNIPSYKPRILHSIAKSYYLQKNYAAAENFAFQAINEAEAQGDDEIKNYLYDVILLSNIELGNKDRAIEYFELYRNWMINFFQQTFNTSLSEMEVKYETEKKEHEIERQQQVISQKNRQTVLLVVGIAMCALFLILLWYMLQLRNRRNRTLAEMNATKDKFFGIISHDLKNPALAQRSALKKLIKNAKLWDNDTLTEYYDDLLQSADGQVELIYNLLSWAQLQTGRMTYTPDTFAIDNLLSDLSLIRNMAENKGITFTTQIPKDGLVTCDSNMLTTVVRNLLTNAVKFTSAGGTVSLSAEQTGKGNYAISVSDTGIGMSSEQISQLFHLDKAHSRNGTAGEQGSGLGLIVCQELLEKHDSTLHVESEEGKGSRFWFEV